MWLTYSLIQQYHRAKKPMEKGEKESNGFYRVVIIDPSPFLRVGG
jgi:hypothetical protein